MMRGLLPTFPTTIFVLALLATTAGAQAEEAAPQRDAMLHMDNSTGAWRYLPEQVALLPGATLQLMVFGEGQFSIVLDDRPETAADIAMPGGPIRTAELRAPDAPGRYPFHDKYHPEARGVLVVATAAEPGPTIGVVPGGYESTFAPARLEVDAGATVRFLANGTFGHNLRALDGSFDAGDVSPGGSASFVAPAAPGEYPFECRFHAGQGMTGTLVVRALQTPPSTPGAPTRDVAGFALGGTIAALGVCAFLLALRHSVRP